jgi:hypothetical protein
VRSVSAGEISLLSRDEPNSVVSPEEPPCQDSPDVADSNEEASSEEAAAAVDLLEAERVKKKIVCKKKNWFGGSCGGPPRSCAQNKWSAGVRMRECVIFFRKKK